MESNWSLLAKIWKLGIRPEKVIQKSGASPEKMRQRDFNEANGDVFQWSEAVRVILLLSGLTSSIQDFLPPSPLFFPLHTDPPAPPACSSPLLHPTSPRGKEDPALPPIT